MYSSSCGSCPEPGSDGGAGMGRRELRNPVYNKISHQQKRIHRGAASVEPGRTVRTGPNLNSTQNGDPKDTYLQCEGRNKHDEVMCIPKRFCKSLLKSRDMTVCIWHKSVCTLPRKVRTRFEQTRFGLHLVCKCCEAMFRCCNIICELGAFLFA